MKQHKFHFIVYATAMLAVTLLSACSEDDYSESVEVPSADGTYSYTLHMDCQIADSMGEGTRASMSLTSGTTIYLRFYNNGSYTSGTAVYNSGQWTFTTSNSLPTTTSGMTCEAYYFKNPGTVYTSSINLTENTACYQGSGNYSHPTASDVFVSVSLKPKNWRLRFYGRASGTITVLGSSSDISYYTSFNRSTGEFGSTKKDLSLSISNGSYSSYIYGFFATPSSSNKITVKTVNDGNMFSRTINGTTLQSKGSGWVYAPHSSNYTGWTLVSDNSFAATMSTTNYKAAGDYWNLNVTASSGVSWTVSANQSWVHFTSSKNSSYYGTGNGSVAVYVDATPDLYSRSATVSVKCGSVTKTVTITQEAGTLTASMSTTSYKADGDYWYLDVTASSGVSWTASSNQSWVHFTSSKYSTYSGKGNNSSLAVYVDANPNTYSRSATVYVKSGSTTRSITITQAGKITSPYTINSVEVANVNSSGNFINSWGSTIYSSRTQYLAFRITARVNTAGYYNLQADLYSPGNVYEVTWTWDSKYRSVGSVVFTTNGWGKSTYGAWASGQYKLVVKYQSQTIYTHNFRIY